MEPKRFPTNILSTNYRVVIVDHIRVHVSPNVTSNFRLWSYPVCITFAPPYRPSDKGSALEYFLLSLLVREKTSVKLKKKYTV